MNINKDCVCNLCIFLKQTGLYINKQIFLIIFSKTETTRFVYEIKILLFHLYNVQYGPSCKFTDII